MLVNAMIRIFFFLKDKTWCLWSNHANQQATHEGSQKAKKTKSWKVTLLANVMIKFFWKTKHDALDHQLAIADGPTPQLTDKVDWAIWGNTNQVLQRCTALVRRIKLDCKARQLRISVHNSCGVQDNKYVRVVRTEALCHGCFHILPRWPRRKSSQPQVQETNPLLERWVTHKPPTHQKYMPAPAAATRAWSSNGSSRAAGLRRSPLPAYQQLSRSSCLFPSFAAHTWLRIFSFNSIPNAFQRASHWMIDMKWMPQLIVVSFHVLKREYARAQLLSWHSHIRGGK